MFLFDFLTSFKIALFLGKAQSIKKKKKVILLHFSPCCCVKSLTKAM